MISVTHDASGWPRRSRSRAGRGPRRRSDRPRDARWRDGLGECVPYARYGETMDSVAAQIEGLPEASRGRTCRTRCRRVRRATRSIARCGTGRRKRDGAPVHRLAGLPPPGPVVTAFTLSLDTPDNMRAAAARHAHRPLLKIKLGTPDDMPGWRLCVRARRSRDLIVDANEGWTAEVYSDLAPHLLRLGVKLVEQPLPAGRGRHAGRDRAPPARLRRRKLPRPGTCRAGRQVRHGQREARQDRRPDRSARAAGRRGGDGIPASWSAAWWDRRWPWRPRSWWRRARRWWTSTARSCWPRTGTCRSLRGLRGASARTGALGLGHAHVTVFDCEHLTNQTSPSGSGAGPDDPDPLLVQIGAVHLSLDPPFGLGKPSIASCARGSRRAVPPLGVLHPAHRYRRGPNWQEGVPCPRRWRASRPFTGSAPIFSWGKDEITSIAPTCFVPGSSARSRCERFGNAASLLLKAGVRWRRCTGCGATPCLPISDWSQRPGAMTVSRMPGVSPVFCRICCLRAVCTLRISPCRSGGT
jgi:hypothetical protein